MHKCDLQASALPHFNIPDHISLRFLSSLCPVTCSLKDINSPEEGGSDSYHISLPFYWDLVESVRSEGKGRRVEKLHTVRQWAEPQYGGSPRFSIRTLETQMGTARGALLKILPFHCDIEMLGSKKTKVLAQHQQPLSRLRRRR